MAKPKLALIPAAQGDKFYSVLPSDGVGDFTFTRASTGTRIAPTGLIEEVPSGDSRLDYDLLNGKVVNCPHYLLEPASTNLITYSEDFSNSSWTKADSSITSNSVISPDGALNGYKLTENTSNSLHGLFLIGLLTSSGTYSFSFFVKKSERSIFAFGNASSGTNYIVFNLDNLTTKPIGTGGATISNDKIENYGNDWYRCSLKMIAPSAISLGFLLMKDESNTSYLGDGTSGLYIYGAMLEQLSYPTSYIPTNGTAITRAAETATGSGNAATFNDSEGVLMVEASALANDGTYRNIALSDGSFANRILVQYTPTANQINIVIIYSGVQYSLNYTVSNATEFNKFLIKYKTNDLALWVNGFEVDTDTNALLPSGLNTLSFDNTIGDAFYSNTREVQYFDSVLTDAQLETLTSWTSLQEMITSQLYTNY